jgi:hypothetical protein
MGRKQTILVLLLIFFSMNLHAQEKLSKEEKARREKNIQAGNPFIKYGSKAKVATLSKGKYLEVHDLDSIVTIGTVRWHVDKQYIVERIVLDSLNPDAQPIGDRVGRWMSPDPLSEEFPSWSPYTMCYDNPIQYKDPDGRAAYSPIYGTNGQFLGTDSQGFKGNIIFMQESTFMFFGGQGMNHNTAMQLGSSLSQVIGDNPSTTFTKSEVEMVNNAVTDVVSRTKGYESDFISGMGTPFNDKLHNGKTSSSYFEMGRLDGTPAVWQQSNDGRNLGGPFPAVASTNTTMDVGKALITFNLQEFRGLGFTVENLQNVWVHEYGKHFLDGVPGGNGAAHAGAIIDQSLHITWKGTTELFKENMRNVYEEYMNKQLGR